MIKSSDENVCGDFKKQIEELKYKSKHQTSMSAEDIGGSGSGCDAI